MTIRVLFADDQIPWDDKVRDDKVKSEIIAEIGEKLRAKGSDPDRAYEEDKAWLSGLIQYLSVNHGCDLTLEREYSGAEKRILGREKFDVFIVDLSWTGDGQLPRGKRSNVGLKLIEEISLRNPNAPVIAFSQNFEKDSELMALVTKRNAFPMQKHYSNVDYQGLASAIAYFTRNSEHASSATVSIGTHGIGRTFWDVFSGLPRFAIPIALLVVLVAVVGFAHMNTKPGETVTAFGVPLYKRMPSPVEGQSVQTPRPLNPTTPTTTTDASPQPDKTKGDK